MPQDQNVDLRPGDTVGPYILERVLGRGPASVVFLAKGTDQATMSDISLVRELHVALKLVEATERDVVEEIKAERFLMAAAEHHNVVRTYDAGRHGPWFWIAMEYVRGHTWAELIRTSNLAVAPIPRSCVVDLMVGACRGLGAAHNVSLKGQTGIVHLDIKPSNLMLDEEGMVKVLDFGIAKGSRQSSESTEGFVRGTAPYMAPEQHERGGRVDTRTDIFALGAVLYELLVGEVLYPLKDAWEKADIYKLVATKSDSRHLEACLEEHAQLVGPFAPLLKKMLAPEVSGRPGSVETVIRALNQMRFARHGGLNLQEAYRIAFGIPSFPMDGEPDPEWATFRRGVEWSKNFEVPDALPEVPDAIRGVLEEHRRLADQTAEEHATEGDVLGLGSSMPEMPASLRAVRDAMVREGKLERSSPWEEAAPAQPKTAPKPEPRERRHDTEIMPPPPWMEDDEDDGVAPTPLSDAPPVIPPPPTIRRSSGSDDPSSLRKERSLHTLSDIEVPTDLGEPDLGEPGGAPFSVDDGVPSPVDPDTAAPAVSGPRGVSVAPSAPKTPPAPTRPATAPPKASEGEGRQLPLWLLALGAVVVAALLALAIVVLLWWSGVLQPAETDPAVPVAIETPTPIEVTPTPTPEPATPTPEPVEETPTPTPVEEVAPTPAAVVARCYPDQDQDGYGAEGRRVRCGARTANRSGDCDDTDPTRHPGSSERVCDGIDADCDGLELCYEDLDGDGLAGRNTKPGPMGCEGAGMSCDPDDCDDRDPRRAPNKPERCNQIDDNCDGVLDEGCPVAGDVRLVHSPPLATAIDSFGSAKLVFSLKPSEYQCRVAEVQRKGGAKHQFGTVKGPWSVKVADLVTAKVFENRGMKYTVAWCCMVDGHYTNCKTKNFETSWGR